MANDDQPPSTAQVSLPPPQGGAYRHALDQDYAISMLMEVQKTLGKIDAQLEQVLKESAETKSKVSHIEKVIYASAAILTLLVAVGAFAVYLVKDFALLAYKASLEQPKIVVPLPSEQQLAPTPKKMP